MKSTPELEAKAQAESSPSLLGLIRPWRYFFYFLALLVVIGGFYLEENWRGARAWLNYKQRLESRGEPMTADQFVPAPVPDSQNFAMTPLLAPLFEFIPGTQKWVDANALDPLHNFAPRFDAASSLVGSTKSPRSSSWVAGLDLRAWHAAFLQGTNRTKEKPTEALLTNFTVEVAAAGVLSALSESESVLDELRAASQRKYSRFNIRYEQEDPASILLPHLSIVKHFCAVLQLQACAKLALGKTDEAFRDLHLMLYLADALRDEPIMISQLIRMAELQRALQPLAAGMDKWSDAQLQVLQEQLVRFDFCADLKRTLRAERTLFGGGVIEFIRQSSDRFGLINQLASSPGAQQNFSGPGALMVVAPNGWFYLERLNLSRTVQDYLLPAVDLEQHQIPPEASRKADAQSVRLTGHSPSVRFLKHQFFSALVLPAISMACQKTAFAQTGAEVAAVACALERYRRRHGQLPEGLTALAPEFLVKLPHDIINGQPLKYRRLDGHRYIIYSVGWNETDDAGAVGTLKGEGSEKSDGDWVWQPN